MVAGGIVNILGQPIRAQTMAEALARVEGWVAGKSKTYVCFADVHALTRAGDDPELAAVYRRAGMVTSDGMPLVWLCRKAGWPQAERVYGPDLMLACCAHGLNKGWRHYFYGGTPEALAKLTAALTARFPGLIVAGCESPPFHPLSEAENADALARIDAAAPDLLWIGLGAPKQELWMGRQRDRLEVPVMLGVGAAFDFLSGAKPQAPTWMRRHGLEWLFRLASEPRRLAKRYAVHNSRFLWRLLRGRVDLHRLQKTLVSVADLLFDRISRPLLGQTREQGRLVLLIRADHGGDAVLWLPAFMALRDHYRAQGYRIAVAASGEAAPILGAAGGIDEMLTFSRNRLRLSPAYRLHVLRAVRGLGAEIAIAPASSRESAVSDAIIRASGAAERIGWSGDLSNLGRLEARYGDAGYSRLFDASTPMAELRRNELLLEKLGLPLNKITALPLPRAPLSWRPPRRYAVLCPGAASPLRRWPAASFAAVADLLHDRYGLTPVLCASPGEEDQTAAIAAVSHNKVVDLGGRTSLAQFVAILEQAEMLVANDSLGVHLAASLRVPSLCLLGGGHHGRFLPYGESRLYDFLPPVALCQPMPCFGCNWRCPLTGRGRRQTAPCLLGIEVAQVAAEIEKLLPSSQERPSLHEP